MHDFISFAKERLNNLYQTNEINYISRMLLEKFAGIGSTQFYSGKDIKIPDITASKLREALNRLGEHEPLQYVLGETEFSGLMFHVRPGVLIPRPETEELVELIIKDAKSHFVKKEALRIIDFCSGSGCIAISLSKKISGSLVEGWDISQDALEISKENASRLSPYVQFLPVDILNYQPSEKSYGKMDILVSNPPYVCNSEQDEMETKVLKYEPHLALFVDDSDPLIFYRKIGELSEKMLKKGGFLYFEINSRLWKETMDMMKSFTFQEVRVFKDISGRERFIRAKY